MDLARKTWTVCSRTATLSLCIFTLLTVVARHTAADGGFAPYHDRSAGFPASPGALRSGLYGFANPAMAATIEQPDLSVLLSTTDVFGPVEAWGVFGGVPGLGLGALNSPSEAGDIHDVRVSVASEVRGVHTGISYGWHGGAGSSSLHRTISAGLLLRSSPFLSTGVFGTSSLEAGIAEGVVDIGVRPTGTELLTVFGDYAIGTAAESILDGTWSAGFVAEPLPGLRFTSRYVSRSGLSAGVSFSTGRTTVGYQARTSLGEQGSSGVSTGRSDYTFRAGAYDRNIFDTLFAQERRYVELRLGGPLTHRGRFIIDPTPNMWAVVETIEQAHRDPTVAGILINARGARLSQSMAWELSEHLNRFRSTGKRVVLYIENGGMDTLYLISSADRVVMDPEGSILMSGFLSPSTYLADLLAYGGVGAEEFRFAEYKSGFESFVRSSMSAEDREQRQAFVDVYYERLAERVSGSRDIAESEFNALVDFAPPVRAQRLLEAGLVDAVSRYPDIEDELSEVDGFRPARIPGSRIVGFNTPTDNRWEPAQRIGLVYAVGETMPDSGMRARDVAATLRAMREDPTIRAIVLRIDSPGGSILASEMVADEVRRTTDVKPVIASMAGVAASGGYWISMYADRIISQPATLTGSIGVIGGWFFDDGLSDRLRLNFDSVQRGDSADLFSGPTLPLVGLGLPGRGLTERERAEFLSQNERFYDEFLDRVAEARDMDRVHVEEIAAGRVWTGTAAVENGLVDGVGTFRDAIEIARADAGIRESDRVEFAVGPSLPFFELPDPMDFLAGVTRSGATHGNSTRGGATDRDRMVGYLKAVLESNGAPLAILSFEHYQWYYRHMLDR